MGPLASPTTKKARTSRDADEPPEAVLHNQFGIAAWMGKPLLLDVTQDDLTQAARYLLLGWPDIAQLFGGDGGAPLSDPIFDAAPYRNVAFDSSFTPEAGADPTSIALAEAGAVFADPGGSCVLDAWGEPEFSLTNSHFQVRKLPSIRNREFVSAQVQVGRLPTTCSNPNACLQLFANPRRGETLACFVHAVSLDPPIYAYRRMLRLLHDGLPKLGGGQDPPRCIPAYLNSSGGLYCRRT